MEYKKYKNSRQKSERFWKDVSKFVNSAERRFKHNEVVWRRRKNAIESFAQSTSKENKSNNEPITVQDMMYGVVFLVIIMILIYIFISYGIIPVVCIGVLGIFIAIYIKVKSDRKNTTNSKLSENEIREVKEVLKELEMYQEVIHESKDVYEVNCSLDEILKIVDRMAIYSEKELNNFGVSKRYIRNLKNYILANYNNLLEQSAQREDEESENSI